MLELSIITINRNNAEGLKKTIDSVVFQTSNDFEYLIIDGNSSDGSVDVIKSYTKVPPDKYANQQLTTNNQQPITYWTSEPDSGVYQAMNKGIRMVKGVYILFLNSGDYLVNNNVIKSVFDLDIKMDILCGRCEISESGKVVHTTNPPENVTFGTLYSTGLAHQSTFIKKELFDNLGSYREDFKYNADIEFWYRSIILNGSTTQKIDVVISDYNLGGISSTQNTSKIYLKEIELIFSHPIFKKIIPDYEKWKLEKKQLAPLYWVKSKTSIYIFILLLYKIIRIIKKKN